MLLLPQSERREETARNHLFGHWATSGWPGHPLYRVTACTEFASLETGAEGLLCVDWGRVALGGERG